MAAFDEDTTRIICDEYRFNFTLGNIRDLGRCAGHCRLCGKGDSRDDGANRDKLRYEFKLTNIAGGQDLWVGSSCILQHGLHVDGAANAEQAEEILRKSLAEHMRIWKIEAWKAANPDHETIPELWERTRREPYFMSYPHDFYRAWGFQDAYHALRDWRKLFKPFRTASRFYERKDFLTEQKTEQWRKWQEIWKGFDEMFGVFREAMELVDQHRHWRDRNYDAAVDFIKQRFEARQQEIEARKSAKKKRRKPAMISA